MAYCALITNIEIAPNAPAGSRVDVAITIKNTYSTAVTIAVGGALEYGTVPWPGLTFPGTTPTQMTLSPDQSWTFYGYFIMPSSPVTVHAYSYYYGVDGSFHFDDEATAAVALAAHYQGRITDVVIRKNSDDLAVPANLEVGDSCELHAFGLLDAGSAAAKCGMRATVTRPDGSQVTGTREMWTSQDPGEELRFSILNIPVDEAGGWSALIEYYAIL